MTSDQKPCSEQSEQNSFKCSDCRWTDDINAFLQRDAGGSRTHWMRLCRPPPRRVTSASFNVPVRNRTCLRPSQSRVHPSHSKDKMVYLSLNARTTVDDKTFVIAHQKYPTEESNLARLLRRQSCFLHTRRASSFRANRADDWIRTSMIPLTRRTPFSIEPRRQSARA